MSLDDLFNGVRNIVREEIEQAEKIRIVSIEKKVACRLLGISYPTLKDRMNRENINVLYASDIERIRLKYPKFQKK